MTEGDVVITPLPQVDGQLKNRPAVVLRKMPPFGDLLVCGVSSQLHLAVKDFDEVIDPQQADYVASGLKTGSVIRLGFLATLPPRQDWCDFHGATLTTSRPAERTSEATRNARCKSLRRAHGSAQRRKLRQASQNVGWSFLWPAVRHCGLDPVG